VIDAFGDSERVVFDTDSVVAAICAMLLFFAVFCWFSWDRKAVEGFGRESHLSCTVYNVERRRASSSSVGESDAQTWSVDIEREVLECLVGILIASFDLVPVSGRV
jgi:hypothetical protein